MLKLLNRYNNQDLVVKIMIDFQKHIKNFLLVLVGLIIYLGINFFPLVVQSYSVHHVKNYPIHQVKNYAENERVDTINPAILLTRGKRLFESREYREAIGVFQQATESYQANGDRRKF